MNLRRTPKYGIIIVFSFLVGSCSKTDNAPEKVALNATDLEVLENCAQEIQNTEGANCCVVIPNSVTKGGKYIGGAKYTVNEGQGPFEPSGLTYKWEVVNGDGIIIISGIDEQIAMFEFNNDFVRGVIKASIFASDGPERCIATDTVSLKEQ